MFRKLTLDSNQNQYGSVLRINMEILGRLNFSNSLKRKFALFLSIYPLSDSDYETFRKLDKYKKAGFLCSYLIKIAKQNGIGDVIIKEYIKLRKSFKERQLTYKTKNKISEQERIKSYLDNKQYKNILSIYQDENNYNNERLKVEQFTKMILMFCNNNFIKEYKKLNPKEKEERPLGVPSRYGSTAQRARALQSRPSFYFEDDEVSQPQNEEIQVRAERIEPIQENEINLNGIFDFEVTDQPQTERITPRNTRADR